MEVATLKLKISEIEDLLPRQNMLHPINKIKHMISLQFSQLTKCSEWFRFLDCTSFSKCWNLKLICQIVAISKVFLYFVGIMLMNLVLEEKESIHFFPNTLCVFIY